VVDPSQKTQACTPTRWNLYGIYMAARPTCTRSNTTASEATLMIFDYTLGAIVTIALTVYLVYALMRPERF
jgi:K+-transporting ATPase KdpF subunit